MKGVNQLRMPQSWLILGGLWIPGKISVFHVKQLKHLPAQETVTTTQNILTAKIYLTTPVGLKMSAQP